MIHKRLTAFFITASLLSIGLLFAGENYGAYSAALGGAFAVYASGQSWTDAKNGRHAN